NLLPSNTGTINLVAAGSISLGAGLAMLDIDSRFTRYIGSNDTFVNLAGNSINLLGTPWPTLTQALHANDPVPAVIAAGKDI
ncbi:hypothetical protein ABTF53_19815, partial [Acinetobacter baumannii]